jgi:hypothetical protein
MTESYWQRKFDGVSTRLNRTLKIYERPFSGKGNYVDSHKTTTLGIAQDSNSMRM